MSDLPHILNWRRLGPRLTTSGQPTEAQLAEIKAMGVTHVINLGLHHDKNALPDEAGVLAGLGLDYTYIPVIFEDPKDSDFNMFCAALDALDGHMVHVHCIYNARVSAFFYRYAKAGGDLDPALAATNMESIWRPGDDWAAFIGETAAKGQPNRYAGDDYPAPD